MVVAVHTIGSIGEWSGGPARTVTGLCDSIAKQGCSVDLISGHDVRRDGALVLPSELTHLHLIKSLGIPWVRLYPGFCNKVRAVVDRRRAQEGSECVVHDHGIWGLTNISAALASWRASIPYILHPRGMLEPWALQYKAAKKKYAWAIYQRRIIENSALLIATSQQELSSIKQLFHHTPVAVIPNGVVAPSAYPDRSKRSRQDRGKVLFMSRIHPKKNLIGLIQAWNIVCRIPSRNRWILQIAGPDELGHTNEIRSLANDLGLDSRIEFLGPIADNQKSALLDAADVFVLPSFSENFGVVVAEALAHGLPVVATRGSPWSELSERGCGWWVDSNPQALAEALGDATDLDTSVRCAMGNLGYEYVRIAFSWDRIGSRMIQAYEWVLRHAVTTPSFIYP